MSPWYGYAALDLGHFGVKLHRSDDDGSTWNEIATPSYAGVEADEGKDEGGGGEGEAAAEPAEQRLP